MTDPSPIRTLSGQDLAAAAGVCARAMLDNPTHVRAFGVDRRTRQRRLQRFFTALLAWIQRRATLLGAFDGNLLVGVLGVLPPGTCKPAWTDLLRLMPSLLIGRSPAGMLRVRRWLGAWAAHDPQVPHWHLGPLAVDQACQGTGVGSRLMQEGLERVDAAGGLAYLETDTLDNVRFYERRGFVVSGALQVLGVPNWLMQRASRLPD